jgi:hypothetical protein
LRIPALDESCRCGGSYLIHFISGSKKALRK